MRWLGRGGGGCGLLRGAASGFWEDSAADEREVWFSFFLLAWLLCLGGSLIGDALLRGAVGSGVCGFFSFLLLAMCRCLQGSMDTLGFLVAQEGAGGRIPMLHWENEEAFFGVRNYSFLRELPWITSMQLSSGGRALPFILIVPSVVVVLRVCDGFRGILKGLNCMRFAQVVLSSAYTWCLIIVL